MRNLNFFRRSAMVSEGSTLALTVGSPSAHRRDWRLKHLTFMLLFLLGSLNVWGADQLVYTLTPVAGSDNNYANAEDIVITDGTTSITWNVKGNSTYVPWRIGGKGSTTPADRSVFSKSSISDNITKIEIEHGAASSITINSMTVVVSQNNDFSNPVSTLTPSFAANNKVTINRPDGKDWSDCYYKITYNVTVTGTSNKFLEFKNAKFYAEESTGGDVIVKTLKSIAVEGMTTSYEQNDAFSFDGTCTATYSVTKNDVPQADENKTVTPTSVTSPDMTTTGDKTITVSYTENEVTKNTTYDITVSAATPKSSLIFEATCGGSGTANDGVEWTVESDAAESTFDSNRGVHYGTGSKAVKYIELTSAAFSDNITKIEVEAAGANTPSISITVGGETFGETATGITNSNVKYTFEPTPAQSGTEFTGVIVVRLAKESSANGALYVKSVVVTYESDGKEAAGLAYDDADLSNLVKLGDAFTAPTLTNPHSLTVAYESSNTDVAEVNASTGALTIKAVGVAEITASFAGDEDYKAGSAQYALYVVAHEGTEADPYTVADARVVIDKVGEAGIADKYTKGIVSNVKSLDPSKYQRAQYYISDNGERENEIYVYNGYYLSGADFTSADQLKVGDEVVVKGQILKYNKTTYEVAQDNQLVSLNRSKVAAGLEYAETAIEKNIGDAAFTNALTNPNNLEVSYSSSATGVATVDENGEVTIVGMGTTTIKATFAGNGSYLADEVSYTLTVNDPSLVKVTFDATVDIASDNAEGITKNGVNIKASHVDGVNGSNNAVTYYQCFKNATFTATCTSGNIKRIEFSCTSSNPASGFGESYADGVWTGDAATVEITATEKQVQMNTVTVYYKVDARAEAGLTYAVNAIDKHVGDETFVNELTNPNNLTVAYESSNTNVAEVAANGTVTIKGEGATTITASFDGDATYKPASVSYVLTVNEPGLDNVTFNSASDHAASGETTITKGGFTLAFSAGSMDGTYSEYRLHKNQTMTLSSSNYLIKKIEFTCTSGNPIDGFADATGLDKANNQWTGEASKVELTASGAQVRIEKLKVYYVEDTRAASGLAWSTDEVEITLGDDFTAASLVNPNGIDAAEITIESSNTDLATVTAGVVELVADATGTATITATFNGNATYKPAEFSYTITVNDPNPVIYVDKLNVNFASVEVGDAVPAAQTITVTLTNVASVTATLGGTNADAFSISPTSLTASGDITISILANTDVAASYSATLTISDGEGGADDKTVNLSFAVTEPEVNDDVTGTWTLVTDAATLAAGKKVIIAQYVDADGAVNTMAGQASNNRSVVESSVDGATLTPATGTKVMTLADAGTGKFYLQTSNGKYLYNASTSGKSYLRTKDESEDASWTISVTAEGVATITSVENTNRSIMRYNPNTSGSPLFNCYASGQNDIALYMLEETTPPTPVLTDVRTGLTPGNYYTICYPKAMKNIHGATLWSFIGKDTEFAYLVEETATTIEAGKPYILYAMASTVQAELEGADAAAGSNGAIHGTLVPMNQDALNAAATTAGHDLYLVIGNQLRQATGDALTVGNSLPANRAYVILDEITGGKPASAPGRNVRSMPMHKNAATGMDELNASEAPRKMIIDGKMYIFRGEKMYNANGQLVK